MTSRSSRPNEAAFYVNCTGQIENADFGPSDDLYCRYAFHMGPDWSIVSGPDSGISQTARKSPFFTNQGIVWNFPIDLTFKATNVYGWPRLSLNIYGIDFFGRDVVRGYGSILIPLIPGIYNLEVETYVPLGSSILNNWISWLLGTPPEFFDSKFVCQGEGRAVTRVQATGTVRVKLNIVTRGLHEVGYSVADEPVTKLTTSMNANNTINANLEDTT